MNNKNINKEDLEKSIEKIYISLCEKGYDPAGQLAGYILSEDPVYIPDWNNARGLISHINRDELLRYVIEFYFENKVKDKNEK